MNEKNDIDSPSADPEFIFEYNNQYKKGLNGGTNEVLNGRTNEGLNGGMNKGWNGGTSEGLNGGMIEGIVERTKYQIVE